MAQDSRERTAVVVGGGIGGLAAAVGLRRTGWRVTVLERRPELTEAGTGIALLSNALRALDELGIGDALRERGVIQHGGGQRTSSGRWLTHIDGAAIERRVGTNMLVLLRADLLRLLADQLASGTVVTAAEVTDVAETPGQDGSAVTVHYRTPDGEHAVTADLAVAADGINSRVRSRRWPGLPPPAYTGSATWLGVTDARFDPLPKLGQSWGSGAEFGMFPLPDKRLYWYATVTAPQGHRAPDESAAVRQRFADWHSPVPDVLDATDPAGVLYRDLYALPRLPSSYVDGRIALLGDAAHAMQPHLGQGGCQAIEDVVVLAAVLAGGDIEAGLARYDQQRRPRTRGVWRAAGLAARVGQQFSNPVLVTARNAAVRAMPSSVALRAMARFGKWTPPHLPRG